VLNSEPSVGITLSYGTFIEKTVQSTKLFYPDKKATIVKISSLHMNPTIATLESYQRGGEEMNVVTICTEKSIPGDQGETAHHVS